MLKWNIHINAERIFKQHKEEKIMLKSPFYRYF